MDIKINLCVYLVSLFPNGFGSHLGEMYFGYAPMGGAGLFS